MFIHYFGIQGFIHYSKCSLHSQCSEGFNQRILNDFNIPLQAWGEKTEHILSPKGGHAAPGARPSLSLAKGSHARYRKIA